MRLFAPQDARLLRTLKTGQPESKVTSSSQQGGVEYYDRKRDLQ